ncbi:hypothetical protein SEMRO_2501_G329450.1 [Seminavis robusta]|uniref:Uncharacterized protein n=1 Tax=Seminavis robusta TaxID=568900 RepID=A0A9N8F1B9_9STRA|nr:hypothetical protein SEMRO_2501_G329450.1 [Seminavis robusta]|eukprot:Sro2501_g329450.1 n/a (203) ;mRNA; f:12274-12882
MRNKQPDPNPIAVKMPNNTYERNTHTAELAMANLPPAATKIKLFPNFDSNLISIGQICDTDCTATFTSTDLTITDNPTDTTILKGYRNCTTNGLWHLPTDTSPHHAIPTQQTQQQQLRKTFPACSHALTQRQSQNQRQHHQTWPPPTIPPAHVPTLIHMLQITAQPTHESSSSASHMRRLALRTPQRSSKHLKKDSCMDSQA